VACALDADGLEIDRVRSAGAPVDFRLDPNAQKLHLSPAGPGPVEIEFRGTATETGLLGLYRSRQGASYILTTQCEPIGARKIFPCFDRPDRKSRIALTVRTEPDLRVISNMPERSTREVDGRREWTFEPTPTMATYLFYLGVGRFDSIEDASGRVRFRVYTPPGAGPAGKFGLSVVPRVLAAFETYYGIPYPLPKLDLLCVAEASFGAMENWGAITFRDERLLLDASSRSLMRQEILETIAHEVAHMWFGNLVTMATWTDIWLNESLAAFLETKIAGVVDPSLDTRTDFYVRVAGAEAALEGDSLDATHPVRAPVARPEEIAQIFDEISYGKGSTVLGMLEAYLGEEVFRRGVAEYLQRFRYANARTSDLWDALSRAAGEPIAPLMDPWLDRPGLPLISATLTDTGLALEQRRFSYHGPGSPDPWPIPMVLDIDGRRERIRFDSTHRLVPVPASATVHLNPGAAGFYRVRYDPELFERLLTALPARPAADRWSFLEDLGALLAAREIAWPTFARAVRSLGTAPDRLTVEFLAGLLRALSRWFLDLAPVVDLARWFFAGQTARLGIARRSGEPVNDGIVRHVVATGRAQIDLGFARDLAEKFPAWDRADPDVRPSIALARARVDGAAGYRELRRALDGDRTESERVGLETALAWTGEPDLLVETLDRAASGKVNRGVVHLVLRSAAANPAGRAVVWPWCREHLAAVDELLRGSGLFTRAAEGIIPTVGLDRGAEVHAFFKDHPFPEGARGIAKGLERLTVLERLAPTLPRAG
jgi:tricorn protease interacting factor F2/3